jgi:hypothetical protein
VPDRIQKDPEHGRRYPGRVSWGRPVLFFLIYYLIITLETELIILCPCLIKVNVFTFCNFSRFLSFVIVHIF